MNSEGKKFIVADSKMYYPSVSQEFDTEEEANKYADCRRDQEHSDDYDHENHIYVCEIKKKISYRSYCERCED